MKGQTRRNGRSPSRKFREPKKLWHFSLDYVHQYFSRFPSFDGNKAKIRCIAQKCTQGLWPLCMDYCPRETRFTEKLDRIWAESRPNATVSQIDSIVNMGAARLRPSHFPFYLFLAFFHASSAGESLKNARWSDNIFSRNFEFSNRKCYTLYCDVLNDNCVTNNG